MSDARTDALYQEAILTHYRAPHNRRAIASPSGDARLKNALCGDDVRMMVLLDGDRVSDAAFEGLGCSISQATASMLTDAARGRTLAEVVALVGALREMLEGPTVDAAIPDPSLGELGVLIPVRRFPARIRCATLPAEALVEALRAAR